MLAVLLTGMMAVSLLAGCGNTAADETAAEAVTEEAPAEEEAAPEETPEESTEEALKARGNQLMAMLRQKRIIIFM